MTDAQILRLVLQFLDRVPIKGEEAVVFVAVVSRIRQLAEHQQKSETFLKVAGGKDE